MRVAKGDREWAIVIAAISAQGWAIHYPSSWRACTISLHDMTPNELENEWLKLFDKNTQHRMLGARPLLILDSHESHFM
jgi:hypothetical protein